MNEGGVSCVRMMVSIHHTWALPALYDVEY